MNKRQIFRFSTFAFLALILFLMPTFINKVPINGFGNIALILDKLAQYFNLTISQKVIWAQCINAAFIWLTIVLVTRFIKQLLDWRSALFGAILFVLTPRFIGASVLNLIDIPFTFFYILSLTQIFSFSRELPVFKNKRIVFLTLSTIVTVMIHPAGAILVLYLFFFLFTSFFLKINPKWNKIIDRKKSFIYLFLTLSSLSLVLIIISYLNAKYVFNIPFSNPLSALEMLNFPQNNEIQIFDSILLSSNSVPPYYLIKYIFITIPLVTFIGLSLFVMFFTKIIKKINPILLIIVFGSLCFPIIYSFFAHFNATAYWTIYYMSIPIIIFVAVMGVEFILRTIDDRYVNTVISLVLFLLLLPPLRHVIVSAPATSVYFNEISGTASSAFGNYTIDYNSHFPQLASKWLINHIYDNNIREFKDKDTILIITDSPINCDVYFENYPFIKIKRGFYEQFQNSEGEYFMSFANQQKPSDLKTKQWPPKEAFYSIIFEDIPIASFIKREQTDSK